MYRIEITYIDGLTDLILAKNRAKQSGVHSIELLTDNFYKRLDAVEYKQQPVQLTTWDKYQIEFVVNEDYNLSLLSQAVKITIVGDEVTHNAIVLTTDSTKTDSDFRHVVLEYYDINLINYKYQEQPVTNYLRSDSLKVIYDMDRVIVVRVVDGGNYYDYYTMLEVTPTATTPEAASFTNTQDGGTVTTNSIIKQQYELVFYLNGNDIQTFQTLLPLAAKGTSIEAFLFVGQADFNLLETSEVVVEKISGVDIYKATINYIYNIKNHYQYGTS